ncbi:hypothetical protein B0T24DRAFT_689968 [Lasiosphaeria ovina]|uniref:Uncharacterized protein n=1 Tax=Lasiosphaeria ovina TaxID=92902 RepID=A0AAE0NNK3_9PEZI|nr:hypothetical protein B0T24DRAFT_689968 [Lasiosphaeria ovina]
MTTNNWMDYNSLEQAMRGQSTLEGFDVLVSYSETQLNNLLKTATAADTTSSISVPEFQTSVAGQWPQPALTVYKIDLELTKPNFAFAGPTNSAEVVLSFVLGGNVFVQNADGKTWSAPTTMPPGLTLSITSQLAAVTGTVDPTAPGSRFVPVPPTTASNGTGVSLAASDTTGAIVIYIPKEKGSGGTVSITGDGTVDPGTTLFLQSLIKGNMEDYFASQPWNYYLAQVNNAAPENSGGKYELQPTSFGFSVSAGNGSTIDNAICMWITVQGGSGRAVLLPGEPCNANFSVQNEPTMPIPTGNGSTASIIFGHDLIESLLFETALKDNNCTSAASADGPNQPGMKMTFKFPSFKVHKDAVNYNHVDTYFGGSTTTIKKVDAINFDIDDYTATMTLNPGLSVLGSSVGTINWTTNPIKVNWTSDVDTYTMGGQGGMWSGDDHTGTTDITFSFNGEGAWVNNTDGNADILNFAWTLPDGFNIDAVPEKKDLNWWDRIWSDWDNGVPSDLKNLKFSLPSLSSVNSINYFLTTNLLLPGHHVFAPDPLQAQTVNDQKGISIPYDVLLTGSVAQNTVSTVALAPHKAGLVTTTKPRVCGVSRTSRRHLIHSIQDTTSPRKWGIKRGSQPVVVAKGTAAKPNRVVNGANANADGAPNGVKNGGFVGPTYPLKPIPHGPVIHHGPVYPHHGPVVGPAKPIKFPHGPVVNPVKPPLNDGIVIGPIGPAKPKWPPTHGPVIPTSPVGPLQSAAAAVVNKKTVADFIGLVANPNGTSILGQLTATIAQPDLELAASQTLDLLEKNGYSFTADELLAVFGTSTAEIDALASPKALQLKSRTRADIEAAAHKKKIEKAKAYQALKLGDPLNPPPFDLKVFAAKYNITDGPDYAKKLQLIVGQADGTITFDGSPKFPDLTTDATTVPYTNTLSWVGDNGSYTAVFKAAPNDQGVFVSSFQGTATPTGGTAVKFAGAQVAAEDDDDWRDVDIIGTVFGAIGTIFGVIGIVAFVISIYWRKEDTTNNVKKEEILDAQHHEMEERMDRMKTVQEVELEDRLKGALEDTKVPWEELQVNVDERTSSALNNALKNYDVGDILKLEDMTKNPTGADYQALRKSASRVLSAEVQNVTKPIVEPLALQMLNPLIKANYETEDEAKKIGQNAMQPTVDDKVAALTTGQESYLDAKMRESIIRKRLELKERMRVQTDLAISQMNDSIGETSKELERNKDALKQVEADLKKDPKDKKSLEMKEDLERDIKRLTDDLKKQNDALEAKQREGADLEESTRIDDEAHKEAERDAAQHLNDLHKD